MVNSVLEEIFIIKTQLSILSKLHVQKIYIKTNFIIKLLKTSINIMNDHI